MIEKTVENHHSYRLRTTGNHSTSHRATGGRAVPTRSAGGKQRTGRGSEERPDSHAFGGEGRV